MNHLRKLGLAALLVLGLALGAGRIGAAEESRDDSAEGLPEQYAENYLVSKSTMSRDKKFAVIYPTLEFSESKEAKDVLADLRVGDRALSSAYYANMHQSRRWARIVNGLR